MTQNLVHRSDHIHHAVWREYYTKLLEGVEVYIEYSTEPNPDSNRWKYIEYPSWSTTLYYRIATPTPTRKVEFDLPKSSPVKPAVGARYWVPNLVIPAAPKEIEWINDAVDNHCFRMNLVFTTAEAAAEAARAICAGLVASKEHTNAV